MENIELITRPLKNTTAEERSRAIHAVEKLGMTVTQAANFAGISRSAVHRIKHQKLDSVRHAAGGIDFVEVAEYTCPKHGKTSISPCVACTAAARITAESIGRISRHQEARG